MRQIQFNTKTNMNIKNKQLSITLPKKKIKKNWDTIPKNIKVTLEFLE